MGYRGQGISRSVSTRKALDWLDIAYQLKDAGLIRRSTPS